MSTSLSVASPDDVTLPRRQRTIVHLSPMTEHQCMRIVARIDETYLLQRERYRSEVPCATSPPGRMFLLGEGALFAVKYRSETIVLPPQVGNTDGPRQSVPRGTAGPTSFGKREREKGYARDNNTGRAADWVLDVVIIGAFSLCTSPAAIVPGNATVRRAIWLRDALSTV